MCGIVGYVHGASVDRSIAPAIRAMQELGHRGPDDEGLTLIDRARRWSSDWAVSATAPDVRLDQITFSASLGHDVAFGHRRFSIVDLTVGGHQPLWTSDRKVCVSLNGEIYNHVDLRQELEQLGWVFSSSSDTEVFAIAYQEWGTDCFARINGFWAISLYDAEHDRVLLARDRLGKAPLYYTSVAGSIYWASEINALRHLAPIEFTVRDQSVVDFVDHRRKDYDNTTFFNEVKTLPSATWAWVEPSAQLDEHCYWQLPQRRFSETEIGIDEATGTLRSLLIDSTDIRLQADVPAAVQVSGGLDSSAVLALAAQASPQVSAFTVYFGDAEVDEEPYARKVAERYGSVVDYNVFQPPDADLLDDLDFFVGLMGEPFHSPNQYTARGIWESIAAKGFKVNLYGSGGDEVFAGYSHLYFYPYIRHLLKSGQVSQAKHELVSLTDRSPGRFGSDYLLRAFRTLPQGRDLSEMVRRRRLLGKDIFRQPDGLNPRPGPSELVEDRLEQLVGTELLNYWLRIDNQNAMSIPLELRAPLLDYRIVEFAFSLPLGYLMRDGWMKWILRKAVEDDLPADVVWRRNKAGFPFPLSSWLIRHRHRLLSLLNGIDCPYIDLSNLADEWELFAKVDPSRLWGVVSLGLWWKKVIEGKSLV